MKISNACCLVALAALPGLPLAAHAQTASEMVSACAPYRYAIALGSRAGGHSQVDAPGASAKSNFCWGAFATVQDFAALQVAGQVQLYPADHPERNFCLPPGIDRLQLIKTFLKFTGKHAELASNDFGIVAKLAMSEQFPCSLARSQGPS